MSHSILSVRHSNRKMDADTSLTNIYLRSHQNYIYSARKERQSEKLWGTNFPVPNGLITYLDKSCFLCFVSSQLFHSRSLNVWMSVGYSLFCGGGAVVCMGFGRLENKRAMNLEFSTFGTMHSVLFPVVSIGRRRHIHSNGVETSKTFRIGSRMRGSGCLAGNFMNFPLLGIALAQTTYKPSTTTCRLRWKCFWLFSLSIGSKACFPFRHSVIARQSTTLVRATSWIVTYRREYVAAAFRIAEQK